MPRKAFFNFPSPGGVATRLGMVLTCSTAATSRPIFFTIQTLKLKAK
jgi:hypothetical protein